jgi:hypothetical protein
MKKHYILNRPMFNRGGVSAYGKGIASNLVTEEQRQRFNYGGRVGLYDGGDFFPPINKLFFSESDYGRGQPWRKDLYRPDADRIPDANRAQWEQRFLPLKSRKTGAELYAPNTEEEAIQQDVIREGGDTEVFDQDELEIARKRIEGKRDLASMPDSDTMKTIDWESILKPTPEQKRRTKGEAQLNLAAGALDVFSQPTIAKGMRAASPHLSKLAQTASADQKAREKAILQGKVLSKVYTDRAGAKGKQDRLTAAAVKGVENTASNLFWGVLDVAQEKKGKAKDVDYAYAYERASKKPTQIIKKEEDKAAIEANPEQFKDTVFVMGSRYLKLNEKTGRLEDITKEVFESFKG